MRKCFQRPVQTHCKQKLPSERERALVFLVLCHVPEADCFVPCIAGSMKEIMIHQLPQASQQVPKTFCFPKMDSSNRVLHQLTTDTMVATCASAKVMPTPVIYSSPIKADTNGYGSIPIDTIFSGLFTSINPSYFDVHQGYQGFDPSPNKPIKADTGVAPCRAAPGPPGELTPTDTD